jgi:hypothetical protein
MQSDADWDRQIGSSRNPRNDRAPAGDNEPVPEQGGSSSTADPDASVDPQAHLNRLIREGGEEFIAFMLAQAIPIHSSDGTVETAPQHYRDILKLSEEAQKQWRSACQEEINALIKRDVIEVVDLPQGYRPLSNRWVFLVKPDGRRRARLVVKGFLEIEGIDYNEIFSPVVRFETVRIMLALGSLQGWHFEGLDVVTAFLYGELTEKIFMKQPEGFVIRGKEHKVLRLKKALYGLKQASNAWWKALSKSLKKFGFKRTKSDAGIFIWWIGKDFVILIVYVDDLVFCGPNQRLVRKKKAEVAAHWECRDSGPYLITFLALRIRSIDNVISIDQQEYLLKVIDRLGLTNAKVVKTPLPEGYKPLANTGTATAQFRQEYQRAIGSLLYLMIGTRPDICYAVTKMAQFSSNPSQDHMDRVKHIGRYLVGTKDYTLTYNGAGRAGLIHYTDSDWGSDPIKRRSTTGFFGTLAGGAIHWTSRMQKTVAQSSTEAEYMALSDCGRQAAWLRSLFSELGIKMGPLPVYGDNQGSIFLASNPLTEKRTKHIDIKYHYIRDLLEEEKVELFFVSGNDNPADLLTKSLGHIKFNRFRSQLGLTFNT